VGDSETTPGGRALKFYSHMRMRVVRIGKVYEKGVPEDEKNVIATKSVVKIIKNKLAAPFGEATFEIPFQKEANNPVVDLVKAAYEVKAVGRKNIEEKMTYVFGKGKEQEVTGCTDFISLAAWFVKNNKVKELVESIREKAKEKGIELSQTILNFVQPELNQEVPESSATATGTPEETTDTTETPEQNKILKNNIFLSCYSLALRHNTKYGI